MMGRSRTDFVSFVEDQLADLGRIERRDMFGGHGLLLDDVMFAIVVDDALYLKVDEANRPSFEAAGSAPFTYVSAGRAPAQMSYWEVPGDVLEDADALSAWASEAFAAALRARAAKERARRQAARRQAIAAFGRGRAVGRRQAVRSRVPGART